MKRFLALLLFFSILTLSGCAVKTQSFTLDAYGIGLEAPEGWAVEDNSSFDLQLTNGTGYMSLMAYSRAEVDMSSAEVHAWHDESLLKERENVRELEAEHTTETDNKTVTTVVYAAGLDGEESYYSSSMVELGDGLILWLVISGPVDDFDADRDMIEDVLSSLNAK